MKFIPLLLVLAGCLKSSDNDAIGQIKKVVNKTPIICPDYTEVHMSLGVVRNGVGSMSHEDLYLAVDNDNKGLIAELKAAAESGAIVKLTYDVKRVSPCWPDHRLSTFAIEATPSK